MLEKANIIRRKKAWENKMKVYELIDSVPGLTIYDISKKLGWAPGKIEYYVKKLVNSGLIQNSTEIVNGRVHKSYTATKMKELINWDEMTHTSPEDIKE